MTPRWHVCPVHGLCDGLICPRCATLPEVTQPLLALPGPSRPPALAPTPPTTGGPHTGGPL